jgi:hypothetical protein
LEKPWQPSVYGNEICFNNPGFPRLEITQSARCTPSTPKTARMLISISTAESGIMNRRVYGSNGSEPIKDLLA